MSFEFPIRKFFEGIGNINYQGPTATVSFKGANNGVSIDGTTGKVVLGNDAGGSIGQLISNRDIPLNTFTLAFTQIGKSATSFPIFRSDPVKAFNGINAQFQNSASVSICDIRIPDNSSLYIGFEAGLNIAVTGRRSVGIGNGALRGMTVADSNIAIGFQALFSGTVTATNTIGIGSFAFFTNSTGANNIGLGTNAGVNNTTGAANTYIGTASGGKNQTGSNNVAVGSSAMAESLVATSNRSQNVAIGTSCAQQSDPGTNNVYMGFKNCFNITAGDNNVSIGGNSFINAATIGAGSVYIGGTQSITGVASAGANNIWIGANITIATAGITNTTLIGQGMSTTISNIATVGRLDQNVLIGFTATTVDNGSRLQINGSVTTTQPSANGAGAWLLGKRVAAAVVLDATQYVETSVDGTIRKLALAV